LSPSGGAMMEGRSSGQLCVCVCVCVCACGSRIGRARGTSFVLTGGESLPLAPCDDIKTGECLSTSTEQTETPEEAAGRRETRLLFSDDSHAHIRARRIGLFTLNSVSEIDEGGTLVSETISEIRHGAQPECEV